MLVEGYFSDWNPTTRGVPEELLLRFVIYINDLKNVIGMVHKLAEMPNLVALWTVEEVI